MSQQMPEERTNPSSQDKSKAAAAEAAAHQLHDGMIVGLGTGTTSALAVEAIGRRVAAGLRITGIPTSEHTANQARTLGIPLSSLEHHERIDVTIDGADEVELGSLDLIKGRGGALLREKIVASATTRLIIIIDESKLVERLGSHDAIPVEVIPFGWQATERRLKELHGNPILRKRDDGEIYKTDGGHYILDCKFGPLAKASETEQSLNNIVGVVEHGLFLGMTSMVIIGGPGGVRIMEHPGR
jgi:ribose 5-phosphate isomerase A